MTRRLLLILVGTMSLAAAGAYFAFDSIPPQRSPDSPTAEHAPVVPTTTTLPRDATTGPPPPMETVQPTEPADTAPITATSSGSAQCEGECAIATLQLMDLVDAVADGGTFGFILKPVGGQSAAEYNARFQFYPASAIKTVHLVHALRAAPTDGLVTHMATEVRYYADSCSGAGEYRLEHLEALLHSMMIDSSNEATNAIQDHFGLAALQATMTQAGMLDSRIHHRFGCGGPSNNPANTTTAMDLASLYETVVTGKILPIADGRSAFFATISDVSAALVDDLDTGTVRRLASAITTHVYIKEGWYGTTLTAGGIVEIADSPAFVYSVFIWNATSIRTGFDIKQIVAELVEIAERLAAETRAAS